MHRFIWQKSFTLSLANLRLLSKAPCKNDFLKDVKSRVISLRWMDILGQFFDILYKVDNFFKLFAVPDCSLQHKQSLLKRGLPVLWKGTVCFPWEQRLSFESRPIFQKGGKTILTELPPLKVYPFSITLSARLTKRDTCANSVDPDEIAHKEPSHQDLHCLPFCVLF